MQQLLTSQIRIIAVIVEFAEIGPLRCFKRSPRDGDALTPIQQRYCSSQFAHPIVYRQTGDGRCRGQSVCVTVKRVVPTQHSNFTVFSPMLPAVTVETVGYSSSQREKFNCRMRTVSSQKRRESFSTVFVNIYSWGTRTLSRDYGDHRFHWTHRGHS